MPYHPTTQRGGRKIPIRQGAAGGADGGIQFHKTEIYVRGNYGSLQRKEIFR